MPNSPLAPCKYHKMSTGLSAWVCVSVRACVCVSNWAPSTYPSIRLLAPLFIVCLSSFFLSFLFRSLPFITAWIPKCKMAAEREKRRGFRTFLMEGFYISTSLPCLFLNLVQRGEKMRRQMEEKNINKLHKLICCWCKPDRYHKVQPHPLRHHSSGLNIISAFQQTEMSECPWMQQGDF